MNVRLTPSQVRLSAPTSSAPATVLAAPLAAPAPAPRPALASLEAALPAPDAAPQALFASGRLTFDAQAAAPGAGAVLSAPSAPAPLAPSGAMTLRAALAVPYVAPLALADPSLSQLGLVLGALLTVAFALRALAPRRSPPPPQPAMPPAAQDFEALREQTRFLVDRLFAASRRARDPRKAARALDAEWTSLRLDGGGATWDPSAGAWLMTPIAEPLFQALDLPDIVRRIENDGDALSDLLHGLDAEASRARDAEDLLTRLRWWNDHFRQFHPVR